MWVAIGMLGAQPHDLEQLVYPVPSLPRRADAVHDEGLRDDGLHPHARVQRGVGILEDDLHPPPQLPQLVAAG